MKRALLILCFSFGLFTTSALAQCPMCRTAVESGMEVEGNTKGRGLNDGIMYLLATPYLAVGAVGYFWYRKNNRK